MIFNKLYRKLLEDFNIPPRVKNVFSSGPNIDSRGSLPTGFKGANLPGIAPDPGTTTLIKLPKKKKKEIITEY